MNKEVIANNIKILIESKYYYDLYNRLVNDHDSLDYKEEVSAQIFNTILFISQLVSDIEDIKKIVIDILKISMYGVGGTLSSNELSANIYLNIIKKYDSQYCNDGYDKMLDKLKHGVAIHFTTPKIIDKINKDGIIYAHHSMFDQDIEKKILEASELQQIYSQADGNISNYLSQGFGFSKGISMGAQTVGYWMNHTPESLSFLFGGYVFTRDKENAMRYVSNCVSCLPPEAKDEIISLLEDIWDKLVGNDIRLGCLLISRDALEYPTNTYWYEEPPRIEEVRPYNNSFDDFSYTEESRYHKDIPREGFESVMIPSIMQLEEYRKMMPVNSDEQIRYRNPDTVDSSEIDFIFK